MPLFFLPVCRVANGPNSLAAQLAAALPGVVVTGGSGTGECQYNPKSHLWISYNPAGTSGATTWYSFPYPSTFPLPPSYVYNSGTPTSYPGSQRHQLASHSPGHTAMKHIWVLCLICILLALIARFFHQSPVASNPSIPITMPIGQNRAGLRLNGAALGDTRQSIGTNLGRKWMILSAVKIPFREDTWTCQSLHSTFKVEFGDDDRAEEVRCIWTNWNVELNGQVLIKSGDPFPEASLPPTLAAFHLDTFKYNSEDWSYQDTKSKTVLHMETKNGLLDSAILRYKVVPRDR